MPQATLHHHAPFTAGPSGGHERCETPRSAGARSTGTCQRFDRPSDLAPQSAAGLQVAALKLCSRRQWLVLVLCSTSRFVDAECCTATARNPSKQRLFVWRCLALQGREAQTVCVQFRPAAPSLSRTVDLLDGNTTLHKMDNGMSPTKTLLASTPSTRADCRRPGCGS